MSLVAVLALLVRIVPLEWQPLVRAEGVTFFVVELDWLDLAEQRLRMMHSPLYFGLQKLFGLEGAPVFLFRLPAALYDVFACLVFAAIGRKAIGNPGILLFAGVYLLSPYFIDLADFARPYSLLLLFGALFLYGAIGFIRYPRLVAEQRRRPTASLPQMARRYRILVILSTLLGGLGLGWTLNAGILTWIAVDLTVLALLAFHKRWRAFRLWCGLLVIRVLLWLPLVYLNAEFVFERAGNWWPKPLSIKRFLSMTSEAFLFRSVGKDETWLVYGAIGFAVLILVISILGAKYLFQRRPQICILFVSLALIPTLALVLLSIHTPTFVARYLCNAAMGFAALTACGLLVLRERGWRGRGLVAVIVLGMGVTAAMFLWQPRSFDHRVPAGIIAHTAKAPVYLLADSGWEAGLIRYQSGVSMAALGDLTPEVVDEVSSNRAELWVFERRDDTLHERHAESLRELLAQDMRLESLNGDGFRFFRHYFE